MRPLVTSTRGPATDRARSRGTTRRSDQSLPSTHALLRVAYRDLAFQRTDGIRAPEANREIPVAWRCSRRKGHRADLVAVEMLDHIWGDPRADQQHDRHFVATVLDPMSAPAPSRKHHHVPAAS